MQNNDGSRGLRLEQDSVSLGSDAPVVASLSLLVSQYGTSHTPLTII
jgi:hypothetical protein